MDGFQNLRCLYAVVLGWGGGGGNYARTAFERCGAFCTAYSSSETCLSYWAGMAMN